MSTIGEPQAPLRLRPPQHPVERRTVWWWTLQGVAFCAPLLTGVLVAFLLWESARPWLVVALVVVVVATVVGVAVEPWWRLRVHRWEVSDEAVYALSGWWVREWRVAPISRIQTVDTVRGPLEQLFGLATLRVTTASSKGTIAIVGLDHAVAADVAERLTEITQRTPGDAT